MNSQVLMLATVSFAGGVLGNITASHLSNGKKYVALGFAVGGIILTYLAYTNLRAK